MANNYPDGGESQLSDGEKAVMGAVGVTLVTIVVAAVLLMVLRFLGPVSWPVGAAAGAVGFASALLWVRPWETEPPRPPRRRR